MTEQTVQVEVTATEEETFNVCDYCGLEAPDDESLTYVPVSKAAPFGYVAMPMQARAALGGDIDPSDLTVIKTDDDASVLHYHPACARKASVVEDAAALAWTDYRYEDGTSEDQAVVAVFDTMSLLAFGIGVGAAVASVTLLSGFFAFTTLLAALGFTLTALIHARNLATNPAENLIRR